MIMTLEITSSLMNLRYCLKRYFLSTISYHSWNKELNMTTCLKLHFAKDLLQWPIVWNISNTRILDATHSRRLTRSWSSHVIWDQPHSRYPGNVTWSTAKRQQGITLVSAKEVLRGWNTKILHVSFFYACVKLLKFTTIMTILYWIGIAINNTNV